jgi:O-antigen ligase
VRNGRGTGGSGAGAAALIVAAAGIAVLLGLAAGALSTVAVITLAVLGLGAVAAVIARETFRQRNFPSLTATEAEPAFQESVKPRRSSDRILRIPRLLFYAGALTIAQASWRHALTLSEAFFILAFFATCVAVLAGRPIGRVPKALILGVGIFAVGGLISSLGAVSPAGSVSNTLQGVYVMLLWPLVGATVLRTRSQLTTALSLWTISAGIDGFAAITQVAGIHAIAGPLEGNRATGLTDHPNDLGGVCAVALVPALMLATSRLPWHRARAGSTMRAPRWVILGLIAAGLVLSASIAAMLGGLVAILAWLISPAVRAPGRLAVIAALALALIALTLAGSTVTSPTERLQQVTSTSGTQETSGSGGIRIKTVRRALPRIASDPVVGTGLDSAGGTVNIISQGTTSPQMVHGAPVAVWYEAGILGFIGFAVVIGTLFGAAWQSLTAGDQSDLLIGVAISAALIAFVIYACTSPFVFQQYGWFAGVMLIAWNARRDALAEVGIRVDRKRLPLRATAPHPVAQ